jgi:5-(carboxyamino)imidazole ribonucleotide mutase
MKVAVLMGSGSDFEYVEGALEVLKQFGVEHEANILSAHRSPRELRMFIENTTADVFICAAGGAAHLAGVVAAETTKPVIALPIQGKALNGLDSLLSMVQMPPGVPVACVGVGAGKNAGLLAVQILAVGDKALSSALQKLKAAQAEEVTKKNWALQQKLKK